MISWDPPWKAHGKTNKNSYPLLNNCWFQIIKPEVIQRELTKHQEIKTLLCQSCKTVIKAKCVRSCASAARWQVEASQCDLSFSASTSLFTTPQVQNYRRNRRHNKRLPRPNTEWEEQTYLCDDNDYVSENPDLEQLVNGTPNTGSQECTEPASLRRSNRKIRKPTWYSLMVIASLWVVVQFIFDCNNLPV